MRLQALEISGFKSFGKKGSFAFDAPITAIVGPNGSGKSNVAEAFRFVLGEQSIKSMRGKRGEDLIFNGTTQTGRQNKASVKVTFDNADRTLNIDFDTVIIERAVHRDGVNEYFINGSAVRLRDIIELLAAANIGSTGHHIISQGEADRILNATPKDRRAVLEDALGLKSFQYKKIESEKKLQKTEENVAQVELLRKEIQPHIRFLKKQVEKIEQTRVLKEKLSLAYADYLKREKVIITHESVRLEKALAEPRQQLKSITADIVAFQNTLEGDAGEQRHTDILVELENQVQRVRQNKNALLREAGQIEGEMKSLERLQEREERDTQEATVRLSEVEVLQNKITAIIEDADNDISRLKQVVSTIKELFRTFINERRGTSNQQRTSFDKDIASLQARKIDIDKDIKIQESEEVSLIEKVQVLRKEIEASQVDMLENERRVFELQTSKTGLESTINRLEMEQNMLERREEEFKREVTEAIVLVGRDAANFESVHLSEDGVLQESPEKQHERRRELEKMKIRVEELGAGGASHEVLKEYEEVTERDIFLVREIEDLGKSATSLRQLIVDLDEEINRRFRNGVQKINTEFQNYFALMFGGGDAALRLVKPEPRRKKKDTDISFDENELTEEEQEQEEGVDIYVSLPRKKVKGLMMLSGGERALTSIALIFAMSAVNPPPFIILDETDAALDEANSKKYADMIENLAAHSQLILITHNRETMSRASTIYGVTMMQGISELLSIQFEQGTQYAK